MSFVVYFFLQSRTMSFWGDSVLFNRFESAMILQPFSDFHDIDIFA